MPDNKNDCDVSVVLGALLVFSLPLTLLIPDFSVWNIIPKVRVTRFHIISQDITWTQLNAVLISLIVIFFTIYLETRKRKLDDMVEKVLTVSQATDATVAVERERQTSAVKASLELLDASATHYERLMLLRDELRRREIQNKMRKQQHPPTAELSSSEM